MAVPLQKAVAPRPTSRHTLRPSTLTFQRAPANADAGGLTTYGRSPGGDVTFTRPCMLSIENRY